MNELASRIIKLRLENRWKQKELADKLGISTKTLSRLEKGEIGKNGPQHAVLQSVAELLQVSISEVEAMLAREVPKIPQAANTASDSIETTPASVTASVPLPTVPIRMKWQSWRTRIRRQRILYLGATFVCLMLLVSGVVVANSWAKGNTVAIAGQVSCTNNLRVIGVWITAVKGASNYASTHKINASGSIAHFAYTLSQGGAYNVHVGCGGTGDDWFNSDDTEYGSGKITDYKYHSFICQDTPLVNGNGRCYQSK